MKNNEVIRAKQKLDKVFAKIDQLPKEDIELQAHWARSLLTHSELKPPSFLYPYRIFLMALSVQAKSCIFVNVAKTSSNIAQQRSQTAII